MAIKERKIFENIILEYVGQPKISFSVDGSSKLSESTLPNHAVRQTRVVSLPPGCIGYSGQVFVNPEFLGNIDYQIQSTALSKYSNKAIYHYYNVHFEGTITLQLFLDEVALKPNNGTKTELQISTRDNKNSDNVKVFFPPLSYGFQPHLQQKIVSSETGQVISAVPSLLNPSFHKGLRSHSEYQVTYQGDCNLEIFLDGASILNEWLPSQEIPQEGGYTTHKDYLPSDSYGHIFQWIQTGGNGDIALFETDQSLADQEQPSVSNPN